MELLDRANAGAVLVLELKSTGASTTPVGAPLTVNKPLLRADVVASLAVFNVKGYGCVASS